MCEGVYAVDVDDCDDDDDDDDYDYYDYQSGERGGDIGGRYSYHGYSLYHSSRARQE